MRNQAMYFLKLLSSVVLLCLLSACWDIKELQDINYVMAIGIDHDDENYVLYTQFIDFSSVAKMESGKASKPAQTWVGTVKAKTLDLAMNKLYESAQQRTHWSHVTTILLSESVLKKGLITNTDTIGRYQEIRVTPWVFGTREPIEKLFNAPAFFNMSTLNTIPHEPLGEYRQKSMIAPLRFFDFLAQLTEPAHTVLLPSLSVDPATWTSNNEPDLKPIYNGVYAMSEGKLKGYLTLSEISGLRFMQGKTRRAPIGIPSGDSYSAVVALQHPKISKKVSIVSGKPRYQIRVKLSGNVIELRENFTRNEIESDAAKVVEREIRSAYRSGLNIQADLYSLEHLLFKQHTNYWKKLKKTDELKLEEDSLDSIQVNVHLDHIGMKMLKKEDFSNRAERE